MITQLAKELPDPTQKMSTEIIEAMQSKGYIHIQQPLSEEHHKVIAWQIGTIIDRSDVKIDKESEKVQEEHRPRFSRGQPGRYRADALPFHTDNARVDVMSMYCVEQDTIDGAILLLDTSDLAEHFSAEELVTLSQVEVWAPPHNHTERDFAHMASLLSKTNGSYRVYYIPWLLCASHTDYSRAVLERFSDYVKHKEDTQLIKLPVKKHESVFIDNHRMLHGRSIIAKDSKRHFVRFYMSVPAMSIKIKPAKSSL